MPRIPKVTRTIKGVKATTVFLDAKTEKCFEKDIYLSGTFKSEKQMKKVIETLNDCESVKVVYIKSTEPFSRRYAMTEQDFINQATEINTTNESEEE